MYIHLYIFTQLYSEKIKLNPFPPHLSDFLGRTAVSLVGLMILIYTYIYIHMYVYLLKNVKKKHRPST